MAATVKIPKNHTPVVDGSVARQNDAFAFVTPAQQLKEQICIPHRDWQIADFTNDQLLRLA